MPNDWSVVQLFDQESGPADARQKILNETAPFVIKNDTDFKLYVTFGEFYQASLQRGCVSLRIIVLARPVLYSH